MDHKTIDRCWGLSSSHNFADQSPRALGLEYGHRENGGSAVRSGTFPEWCIELGMVLFWARSGGTQRINGMNECRNGMDWCNGKGTLTGEYGLSPA